MTKAEIVNRINQRTGIEKVAISVAIESLMETIKENMAKGDNIYLRGFGTFEIIERKDKIGRNIGKGTPVVVPAHKIPKFKPCKEFKGMIK